MLLSSGERFGKRSGEQLEGVQQESGEGLGDVMVIVPFCVNPNGKRTHVKPVRVRALVQDSCQY